jgi:hypothetical protein
MAVYFQCKSCGSEHRSPAGFVDRQSFDASPMPESHFKCHATGSTMVYARTDMYWRPDAGAAQEVGAEGA